MALLCTMSMGNGRLGTHNYELYSQRWWLFLKVFLQSSFVRRANHRRKANFQRLPRMFQPVSKIREYNQCSHLIFPFCDYLSKKKRHFLYYVTVCGCVTPKENKREHNLSMVLIASSYFRHRFQPYKSVKWSRCETVSSNHHLSWTSFFNFFYTIEKHICFKKDAFLHWHRKWQKLANMESSSRSEKY